MLEPCVPQDSTARPAPQFRSLALRATIAQPTNSVQSLVHVRQATTALKAQLQLPPLHVPQDTIVQRHRLDRFPVQQVPTTLN